MSVIVDSSGNPVFGSGGGAFTPSSGGGGGTLLTASDFTYLGMFATPPDSGVPESSGGDSWGFNYQRGQICGRYVAGQLRILMTGSGDSTANGWNGHHLYEIIPPGTLGTDPTVAPYATLLKNWGSMSPGYRPVVDTNGSIIAGMIWDASQNAVWYSYHARYNVSGWNDPSVGVAVLNDGPGTLSKYGHWRTATGSKRTGAHMMHIPASIADTYFGGRRIGFTSHTTSGNATAPYGPVLQPGPFLSDYATRVTDTLETSPGESYANGPTGSHPRWSIHTQDFMFHDISHGKPRHTDQANYRFCDCGTVVGIRDPGPVEDPYNCANGHWIMANTANKWGALDSSFASVWIDTPTKKGVIYFARINVPTTAHPEVHEWYSTKACCHGHVDIRKENSTPGDQSSGMRNFMLIYDPQTFINRSTGVIANNYDCMETNRVEMYTQFFSGSSEWEDDFNKIDGAWIDSTTNKLYVVKGDRDPRGGGSPGRPMIYVFQVAS